LKRLAIRSKGLQLAERFAKNAYGRYLSQLLA